jgi:ribosomal protein S18 acetylase RimI-like enzyme
MNRNAQAEYEAVLSLRLRAYKEANKLEADADLSSAIAPLDHLSKIAVLFDGDRAIASVAIAFPETQTTLSTEAAFPDGYPKNFPPKDNVLEVSRLCVDPHYQKRGLVIRMAQEVYFMLITSGRKYIVTSTDQKLLPLYKRIGFRKTPFKYAHPHLRGIEHHIIIGNISAGTACRGVNPLVWGRIYRDVVLFSIQKGYLQMGFSQRLWIYIWSVPFGIFRKLVPARTSLAVTPFGRAEPELPPHQVPVLRQLLLSTKEESEDTTLRAG